MALVIFCISIPFIFFLIFHSMFHGGVYELDPSGHKFMFTLIWAPYRFAYWTIFILSVIGAFTLAGLHIHEGAVIFLASAIYSLSFNLWVTLCYESYIATRYNISGSMRSDYAGWKYAITLALGSTAFILFILGMIINFVTISGF
jgi:hypothetical protein